MDLIAIALVVVILIQQWLLVRITADRDRMVHNWWTMIDAFIAFAKQHGHLKDRP